MKLVLIDKIQILKMFREFFTLEFGIIDYSETLDNLCEGINGDSEDRAYIKRMVYGDYWFQGHQEVKPFTDGQQMRIMDFFMRVRAHILREIQRAGPVHQHVSFIPSDSFMSLKFEVIE
jgi:hypothetical protein